MNSLADITMPPVLADLVRAVNIAAPKTLKRLRFAVTFEEYEDIRRYLLAREGKFFSMVKGCPLVIEDHPEHPIVSFEMAPTKAA